MNKSLAWGCLLVCFALPALAQDESTQATAAEPAAAEAAVSTETTSDAVAGESAAADAQASGEVAAEESAGTQDGDATLNLYLGLEFDQAQVDIDHPALQAVLGGSSRFDADFYKLRLGARLFDGVGLEFHAGLPASDSSADELEVKQFYGAYLVPTGVVLETVEVSARLGYAFVELESDLGSQDADGASFGLAAELPLRRFGEFMPNLRFGVGATVYRGERNGRMYGFHGGLRYDFSL